MTEQMVVAVDVGGTTIKGGIADRHGRFRFEDRVETRAEEGPDAVVARILDFAAALAARVRAECGPEAVAAAGVGVPGLVDEAQGMAVRSSNLKWSQVPMRQFLSERLGVPVALGHDVRLGALSEGLAGASRGCTDYLFVTLGTGVGAAVMIGGQAYKGAGGRGGELGHTVIHPDGLTCACGQVGCLEAYASAGAVARRYKALSGAGGEVTARIVAQLAAEGDAAARQVWDEAVDSLALGLANYLALLDPGRVVIGGGMALAGPQLFEPLGARLAKISRWAGVPLVPAQLGDDAGRIGAALAAWLQAGVPREELAW